MARVADNYRSSETYGEGEAYEGLHPIIGEREIEIIGEREIDPSLPPVDYRNLIEQSPDDRTWSPSPVSFTQWPPVRVDFRRYQGSIDAFLEDHESEPTLDKICVVGDDSGENWVVLDAHVAQSDPEVPESWLGLHQALAVGTWFAPRQQSAELLQHLAAIRRQKFHRLVDDHGHVDCCYFGEIGWTPHSCDNRHAEFVDIEFADRNWSLVPTVEKYTWEGSVLDCSIGESVSAALPSTYVQMRSLLRCAEQGPCWLDEKGIISFANVESSNQIRAKALLVRGAWLSAFLANHDVELMVASWHERRLIDRDHKQHPSEDVVSAARIDPELKVHLSEQNRQRF